MFRLESLGQSKAVNLYVALVQKRPDLIAPRSTGQRVDERAMVSPRHHNKVTCGHGLSNCAIVIWADRVTRPQQLGRRWRSQGKQVDHLGGSEAPTTRKTDHPIDSWV